MEYTGRPGEQPLMHQALSSWYQVEVTLVFGMQAPIPNQAGYPGACAAERNVNADTHGSCLPVDLPHQCIVRVVGRVVLDPHPSPLTVA